MDLGPQPCQGSLSVLKDTDTLLTVIKLQNNIYPEAVFEA